MPVGELDRLAPRSASCGGRDDRGSFPGTVSLRFARAACASLDVSKGITADSFHVRANWIGALYVCGGFGISRRPGDFAHSKLGRHFGFGDPGSFRFGMWTGG